MTRISEFITLLLVLTTVVCFGCGPPTQADLASAIEELQWEEDKLERCESSCRIAAEDCYAVVCRDVADIDYPLLKKLYLLEAEKSSEHLSRIADDADAMVLGYYELVSRETKLGNRDAASSKKRLDELSRELNKADAIIERCKHPGTNENTLFEALMASKPEKDDLRRQRERVEHARERVANIRIQLESAEE